MADDIIRDKKLTRLASLGLRVFRGSRRRKLFAAAAVLLIAIVAAFVGVGYQHRTGSQQVGNLNVVTSEPSPVERKKLTIAALQPANSFDFDKSKQLLVALAKATPAYLEDPFYNVNLFLVCRSLDDLICTKTVAQRLLKYSPDGSLYQQYLPAPEVGESIKDLAK